MGWLHFRIAVFCCVESLFIDNYNLECFPETSYRGKKKDMNRDLGDPAISPKNYSVRKRVAAHIVTDVIQFFFVVTVWWYCIGLAY